MKQKLLSWGDDFYIKDEDGRDVYFVDGRALSFGDQLSFQDLGPDDLEAAGDFLDHEYTFRRGDRTVATVSKRWFSWTDTYGVEIADGEDPVLILASAVVVDQACHPDDGKRH
jgi:uncharacterized protein YxjI